MQWLVVIIHYAVACDCLYDQFLIHLEHAAVDNKNIARSLQGPKVQVAVERSEVVASRRVQIN